MSLTDTFCAAQAPTVTTREQNVTWNLMSPEDAWKAHIMGVSTTPKWLEDSAGISVDLPLSKRELFGLVLLAHIRRYQFENDGWKVGYDPGGSEPNDGLVTDGEKTSLVEHKLIPQMARLPALEAILATYEKYAARGPAYGENRTLLIHANRASQGSIKVSSLRDDIEDQCPFDQVLLIACAAPEGATMIFHLIEHYPNLAIAQVDLDRATGNATVPTCEIAPI